MTIAELLEQFTADHSNYDVRRDYVSLSHISETVENLLDGYQNGFGDGKITRLRCYKGYQMEKDLLARINAVYGSRIQPGGEILLFGGLVRGHPDFLFDGDPGDCKSVLMDGWIPEEGKLPRRIFWQMQAYMKYLGRDKGLVIFESRESGLMRDLWVRAHLRIQSEIEEKLEEVRRVLEEGRELAGAVPVRRR